MTLSCVHIDSCTIWQRITFSIDADSVAEDEIIRSAVSAQTGTSIFVATNEIPLALSGSSNAMMAAGPDASARTICTAFVPNIRPNIVPITAF